METDRRKVLAEEAIEGRTMNAGNRQAMAALARDYIGKTADCMGCDAQIVTGRRTRCSLEHDDYRIDQIKNEARRFIDEERQKYIISHGTPKQKKARETLKRLQKQETEIYAKKRVQDAIISEEQTVQELQWGGSEERKAAIDKSELMTAKKLEVLNARPNGVQSSRETHLLNLHNAFMENLALTRTTEEASRLITKLKADLDKAYAQFNKDMAKAALNDDKKPQ